MGQFYLNYPSLQVVLDIEGRELRPGEEWRTWERIATTARQKP
jgi:hypothetical protein